MPYQKSIMCLADWHQRYLQQSRWTESIRRQLFNKVKFTQGHRILEVGSGTGAILDSVTSENPYPTFGIDINLESIRFSSKKNLGLRLAQADGHHLPFQDGAFAIAYCHYLLMWVKHPLAVLKEMRRLIRPGGSIIALAESDYTARIDYPPPLEQLGELQNQALENQGVDIELGRKLGTLFYQAGLSEVEVGILGARWRAESLEDIDKTEWATLHSDLWDMLSKAKLENFKKIDLQARDNAERVLFIPTFYAMGTVN